MWPKNHMGVTKPTKGHILGNFTGKEAMTTFSPELANLICERIASGESLIKICEDEGMPSKRAVMNWLAEGAKEEGLEHFKQFLHQYTRAREDQADSLFDECLAIADNTNPTLASDGSIVIPDVQRSRLQIDTRKWMAGKLKPKKYSDKVDVNLGGQPENPVKVDITLTPEEAYRKLINGDV